jgi:phosphodiesterase/alkaline phosphatase D-like protein
MASSSAFPNGVSSGDVTQTSAVLWTRATETGRLTFQISTDPSFKHVKSASALVTDPLIPVKVDFGHLKPDQTYFYRVIDASGDVLEGNFKTAAQLGTHDGFHFGIVSDHGGHLAPFVAIKNAATAGLELVVKLGDTVYADIPPPAATTLEQFRLAHDEVYSTHLNFNYLAELQAGTSVLAMIDDHEVTDDFAGGAPPGSHPLFAGQPGDFINETPLYANGLQAFNEYNAIKAQTYSGTGEDLFDGAPDLYRYQTYGSDAAIIMVDARSFRDTELPTPTNPLDGSQMLQFLAGSFDPSRTMLGDIQFERLKQDLLDARDKGITWKFVMLPEPIQNFGPVLGAGDRFEGYAAERNALLKFIEENHIENVVFVSSDSHWTSINNLTYQDSLGGAHIASSAFEINTLSAAATPIGSLVPLGAFQAGLISLAQLNFYNGLPNAPDLDNNPLNDKDDFVKQILNNFMTQFGYDPIGLANSNIDATLTAGDYFVGHDQGWTEINVDANGKLIVTTWGIPAYSAADLAANPGGVLSRTPTIVSQFEVVPTSESIIGGNKKDTLIGTVNADVILGADGNDVLNGLQADDYLDGGKGNDIVSGGEGGDRIFGRDGNDRLVGQDGDDRIEGGAGNDKIEGGDGDDTIAGDGGNDKIEGGNGDDTIAGDGGNDLLSGGPGIDTFLFDGNFGLDSITGFNVTGASHDIVQFSQSLFADWTALEGAIADGAEGATIAVNANDVITIVGVTAAELVANHNDVFAFI